MWESGDAHGTPFFYKKKFFLPPDEDETETS